MSWSIIVLVLFFWALIGPLVVFGDRKRNYRLLSRTEQIFCCIMGGPVVWLLFILVLCISVIRYQNKKVI